MYVYIVLGFLRHAYVFGSVRILYEKKLEIRQGLDLIFYAPLCCPIISIWGPEFRLGIYGWNSKYVPYLQSVESVHMQQIPLEKQ